MKKIISLMMLFAFTVLLSSCRSLNQSSTKADLTILDGETTKESEEITFEIYTGSKEEALRIYGRGKVGEEIKLYQIDANKNEIPVSFNAAVHENPSMKFPYAIYLDSLKDPNTGVSIPEQFVLITRHPNRWEDYVFKNISGVNYIGMLKDNIPVRICYQDESCDAKIDLNSRPASIQIKYYSTDISKYGSKRPADISEYRIGLRLNFSLLLDRDSPEIKTPVIFAIYHNKFMQITNDAVVSINNENFMSDAFDGSELNFLKKLDEVLGSSKLVMKFLEGEKNYHWSYARSHFKDRFKLKKEYEVDLSF